ncbi:thiamine diphosphokinase [Yoonia sp. 208BN28-4]|uniref:thiamine diphosphokinase n=1 Tax=Yoonia sp. 208BN28-4 TaxID=3126505 RepID=UPI0030B5467C
MTDPIVRTQAPVALIGGADVAPQVINILQSHAATFVAADGGLSHLTAAGIAPDAIMGDLDSLAAGMQGRFADVIHHLPDQNFTDFQKATAHISAPIILAAGFLGGRLDHTLSVFWTMHRLKLAHVILISDDDVCFLARHTLTELSLPVGTRCALLPFGQARVDTHGLRWDIKDAAMTASLPSTSNETAQPDVRIHQMGGLMITLPLAALPAAIDAVRAE